MCRHTLFFLWKDLRKTQPPLVAGLGLNTSPLVLFYDSPRTHLDHLPSFPRPLFLFLPRFSVTFKINVICRNANPEKKQQLMHMARCMPINCHKMGKRILCMQTAVGVGDLQGSFFPISIHRGLVSRHQKAEHWPRCWNELTSKVTINQTVVPPPSAIPSPKIPSVILKTRGLGERHYLIDSGFRLQHSLAA